MVMATYANNRIGGANICFDLSAGSNQTALFLAFGMTFATVCSNIIAEFCENAVENSEQSVELDEKKIN